MCMCVHAYPEVSEGTTPCFLTRFISADSRTGKAGIISHTSPCSKRKNEDREEMP